jgi:hypothetical protein
MKKTFSFGKVDYNNSGRKINEVVIAVNYFPNKDNKMVFTASCAVWNGKHTDWICGGQCLADEDIKKHLCANKVYNEIVDLWHKYHLNDMHAGTERQEAALDGFCGDYTEQCNRLRELGLYEDNGYKYGTSWLYRAIPEEDEKRILALFNE